MIQGWPPDRRFSAPAQSALKAARYSDLLAGSRLRSTIIMTPTVHRAGSYRYFFFSREETRVHVHVSHPDGEAKFWLKPDVSLAQSKGLSPHQLRTAERFIKENQVEIQDAWRTYFSSGKDT